MAKPFAQSRLLSSPEAGAILNRSEARLCQWRQKGKGPPFVRVGGKYIYREDDVREFAKTLEQEPGGKRGAK